MDSPLYSTLSNLLIEPTLGSARSELLLPLVSRPLPWWVLHGRGYVHIRIRLLPVVVPGDCLASVLTLCLPLLIACMCLMSNDLGLY